MAARPHAGEGGRGALISTWVSIGRSGVMTSWLSGTPCLRAYRPPAARSAALSGAQRRAARDSGPPRDLLAEPLDGLLGEFEQPERGGHAACGRGRVDPREDSRPRREELRLHLSQPPVGRGWGVQGRAVPAHKESPRVRAHLVQLPKVPEQRRALRETPLLAARPAVPAAPSTSARQRSGGRGSEAGLADTRPRRRGGTAGGGR